MDRNNFLIKRGEKILIHYGGNPPKCADCRCKIQEVLDVDHINNDGKDNRKYRSGTHLYLWIIRNNYPKGFQVLCRNCNWLKYLKIRNR